MSNEAQERNETGTDLPPETPPRGQVVLTSLLGLVLAMLVMTAATWLGLQALEVYLGEPALVAPPADPLDHGDLEAPPVDPGDFAAAASTEWELSPRILGDLGAITLLVLPAQAALALLAVLLAIRSRRPYPEALGLRRPRAAGSELLLLVLALPAAMLVGALLVQLLVGDVPSRTMDQIRRMITAPEGGSRMLALAALLSLVPAFAEELFFRGWMQRRLVEAVGPLAGITLASVAFAALHMDPVQSTGVLPISFLLGYVTWRTGSLLPAVLAHAAFNSYGIAMILLTPGLEHVDLGQPLVTVIGSLMLVSPLALLATIFLLERRARVPGPRAPRN